MEPWRRLDDADVAGARRLLTTCCGASRWVERMLARRPFGDRETLLGAARQEWIALSSADWREAFTHHPRIGDRAALGRRFAATRHLSAHEQSGVDPASEEIISALAAGNRAYEERFGYVFIVCATGKSAREMLELLEQRMPHDAETELRVAANEQAKITEIRLLGIQ
jgi:2-oxo-4-hydroxy-4-carboxy-5-ureidoimidazoline decarboxylase